MVLGLLPTVGVLAVLRVLPMLSVRMRLMLVVRHVGREVLRERRVVVGVVMNVTMVVLVAVGTATAAHTGGVLIGARCPWLLAQFTGHTRDTLLVEGLLKDRLIEVLERDTEVLEIREEELLVLLGHTVLGLGRRRGRGRRLL